MPLCRRERIPVAVMPVHHRPSTRGESRKHFNVVARTFEPRATNNDAHVRVVSPIDAMPITCVSPRRARRPFPLPGASRDPMLLHPDR